MVDWLINLYLLVAGVGACEEMSVFLLMTWILVFGFIIYAYNVLLLIQSASCRYCQHTIAYKATICISIPEKTIRGYAAEITSGIYRGVPREL